MCSVEEEAVTFGVLLWRWQNEEGRTGAACPTNQAQRIQAFCARADSAKPEVLVWPVSSAAFVNTRLHASDSVRVHVKRGVLGVIWLFFPLLHSSWTSRYNGQDYERRVARSSKSGCCCTWSARNALRKSQIVKIHHPYKSLTGIQTPMRRLHVVADLNVFI